MTLVVGDHVRVKHLGTTKWHRRRNGRPGRVIRTMSRTVQVHFTDPKFPEEAWFYPEELEEETSND